MPKVSPPQVEQLTTTEAAVLAVLAIEGERSGYELTKAVSEAVGHVWVPARSGLYAALRRLSAAGLARSRTVAQTSRPHKEVHRCTREGRRALDAWLETVEPGARDTFFLKLFVGGLTTPAVLLDHLEQFTADTEERLEAYREVGRTNTNRGHDWYHRQLLDYAVERAEHELDWAEGVAAALRRKRR